MSDCESGIKKRLTFRFSGIGGPGFSISQRTQFSAAGSRTADGWGRRPTVGSKAAHSLHEIERLRWGNGCASERHTGRINFFGKRMLIVSASQIALPSRANSSPIRKCSRHLAGTAWSTKRYLNIELLKDQRMRGAITA